MTDPAKPPTKATVAEPGRSRAVTPLSAWPTGQEEAIPTLGEIGLNQFAPYLLNRIATYWNGRLGEALKGSDVTTTKMRALAVLTVASGITINELSAFAVTEQSTMSRTLDALEEQGLIRRQPKPGDMRVREVFITEQGLTLFATLWPEIYELYSRLFEGVDEMEFRGFIATLHKLMRNTRNTG
jgi:MarR family transcriptional regulator for hemolysin